MKKMLVFTLTVLLEFNAVSAVTVKDPEPVPTLKLAFNRVTGDLK